MTPERLVEAAEVLGWIAERLSSLPEDKENTISAALGCQVSQPICLDLAKYLQDGLDPYDALLATARGDRQLTESQQTLFRLLMPRMK